MTNLAKRSLALILALVLCLSLLPVTVVPVSAADYIYNWGVRGEVATSLSAYAQAFYTGNNTYDALSSLAGGTGTSDAPNSNLYKALQNLMVNAQTHETTYDETKDLFKYTDCQNGGGKISSFYSGAEVGPEWVSGGEEWNREHTWPNSKGDASGNGENDIMMLRPTASSENSSRGNTAYGESDGYYDPNSVSNGQYNLHGDVARIMLYVYVRWGNTGSMWGSSGVIESLEVLVDWMEEDPVDTWEMGRNDSVQSITGTRNVFVDYPELAFKLFGEEVPADMATPSDKNTECQHSYVDGTCSICGAVKPVVTVTEINTLSFASKDQRTSFSTSQQVWEQNGIKLTNNKSNSTSNVADYANPARFYKTSEIIIEHPGMTKIEFACNTSTYASALNGSISGSTINGKIVTVELDKVDTFTFTLTGGQVRMDSLTVTAEVEVTCDHTNTKTVGQKEATCIEEGYTGDLVCADCEDVITPGTKIPVVDHNYVDGACEVCGAKDLSAVETTTATITFDVAEGKRTEYTTEQQIWTENGITVTNLKAESSSNVNEAVAPVRFYAHSSLNVTFPGMLQIVFNCNNETYASALKDSITSGIVEVDKTVVTVTFTEATSSFDIADLSAQTRVDSITVTAVACDHAETTVEGKVDATCTTDGHTGNTVCTVCGATVSAGEVITAPGHNYVDGTCSVCGEKEPVVVVVPTITFDDVAKRTAYDETQQIWAENGITVTNNKASSTSNVADAANPAKFYAHSSLKIEYPGMTKIEFVCAGASYATALQNSISGVAVTVNEKVVTVVLATAQDSFEISDLAAQVQLNSISIGTEVCAHTATTLVGKEDATCTVAGYTGDAVCDACGAIITMGEEIAATGHTFVDGTCSVCGAVDTSDMVKVEKEISFADTAQRTEFDTSHQVWLQNGITVTNNKASSTSDVADYANPARFYKNSSLKIEHPSMTQIVFVCAGSGYATALADAIGDTATVSESNVTVVLDAPTDVYEIAALSGGAVRLKSIQITVLEAAAAGCEHTNTTTGVDKVDATCTAEGFSGKTVCNDCGETIDNGTVTERVPHSFVDGKCSVCNANQPESSLVAGTAYKFGLTQHNLENKVYYLAGGMANTYYLATTENAADAIDVYVEETDGGYYFYTLNGKEKLYINMVVSGEHVNGAYEAAASTVYTFNAEKGTLIAAVDGVDYWFATYEEHTTMGPNKVEYNGFYGMFYLNLCEHTNTTVEGAKDATCTEEGYTGDTVCADCGEILVPGAVIPVTEHTYVNGVCSACGAEKPAVSATVTITFDAEKANRTQYDSTIQVWEENGITVTNNKSASTTPVGDYGNPARFYAGSSLEIKYPGMTKIEIEASANKNATPYEASISDANATVVVDGTKVTITFAQPVDTFFIENLSAQARASSITITATDSSYKLGDIDGNDEVTHNDAIYLLLHVMFEKDIPGSYPLNAASGDIDCNGIVNEDDAVYLLLNVLFGDDFYPLEIVAVLPENEEETEG